MSASLYDGLPLNTPTVVDDNGDVQVIATRTANGGTVQALPHPGGPTDNLNTLRSRAGQALTANATFLALASPSNAQVLAQVQTLTRECSALIRLLLGQLDSTANT